MKAISLHQLLHDTNGQILRNRPTVEGLHGTTSSVKQSLLPDHVNEKIRPYSHQFLLPLKIPLPCKFTKVFPQSVCSSLYCLHLSYNSCCVLVFFKVAKLLAKRIHSRQQQQVVVLIFYLIEFYGLESMVKCWKI